jgi:ubiquinone/menaquinone biosynthesis C-methylase UbiE
MKENCMPRICDYEGSQYRTNFWGTRERAYEDAVERVALTHFLPPNGRRLIEIGAGFGRLVDLYQGYQQVVLVDYARTQLEEAQRFLGHDPRITYVVADVYRLPFVDNLFDTLTMIRVMHHLADVPAALVEIHRIMTSGGTAVIEHANKLNLKAIIRWFFGRQTWNPFDPEPIEFLEMNFNFHPAWVRQQFSTANLQVINTRTLSHFRLGLLKRTLPTWLLVTMDGLAQKSGNQWQLTPSVFIQARTQKSSPKPAHGLFRCPHCLSPTLAASQRLDSDHYILACHNCRNGWSLKNGIYDFKTPIRVNTT